MSESRSPRAPLKLMKGGSTPSGESGSGRKMSEQGQPVFSSCANKNGQRQGNIALNAIGG